MTNNLAEKFEFRSIRQEEAEEAAEIEYICFPPNEACTRDMMLTRIAVAPDLFLVAIDKETGVIAGFLNGLSTDETAFRDDFFFDITTYDPAGKNIMILGLDVRPEYRMMGLGRELVMRYAQREKANGREKLYLTCLDRLVNMYKKFGFTDNNIANSTWGGESWHEMEYEL